MYRPIWRENCEEIRPFVTAQRILWHCLRRSDRYLFEIYLHRGKSLVRSNFRCRISSWHLLAYESFTEDCKARSLFQSSWVPRQKVTAHAQTATWKIAQRMPMQDLYKRDAVQRKCWFDHLELPGPLGTQGSGIALPQPTTAGKAACPSRLHLFKIRCPEWCFPTW